MAKELDFVDISAFVPEESAVFEVMKPGGIEGTGWKITFGGPSHPKAVAWQDASAQRQLRQDRMKEQAITNGRKWKAEDETVDSVRSRNVDWVISRIVTWTPVSLGGGKIEFSDSAAKELLLKREMQWALLQMMEFLNDERSFTQRSAGNLSNTQSAISS